MFSSKSEFMAQYGSGKILNDMLNKDSTAYVVAHRAMASNPNFTKEHSDRLVNSKDVWLRLTALDKSPHVTEDQLKAAINDPYESSEVRNAALYRHFANYHTTDQLMDVVQNHPDKLARDAAFHAAHANGMFNKEHYYSLTNHKDFLIRSTAHHFLDADV